jgi:hypothetical protein
MIFAHPTVDIGGFLPGWARAITVLVGFPAWWVLMLGVFTDKAGSRTDFVAFCVFGSVAVLQTVLIFKLTGGWSFDRIYRHRSQMPS